MSGMLDPVNFSIKETINSVYYTKTQIDDKGYLTTIPTEYITETELNAKGYLTVIPVEYITETELNAKGYLTVIPSEYITETELNAKGYLTSIPAEYITETELAANYTKTQIDTNHYTKTQVQALENTNMTFNTGTNEFDVSVPASYGDSNVRTVLSTSDGSNMSWNTSTNKFDVSIVFPPSYTDANVRTVLSTSAGTNMTWNTSTNKFDVTTTLSGNDIILNSSGNRSYGWTSTTSALGRAAVADAYSTGSIIGDIVLRSTGNLRLQSGTGAAVMVIDTANNIGIGITAPSAALDIVKTHNSGTTINLLNMRFDNNWGLRFQQSYTGAGNIQLVL
jgi:hypothetical protein